MIFLFLIIIIYLFLEMIVFNVSRSVIVQLHKGSKTYRRDWNGDHFC